uniref:Uncharacterized protein n=1 Tax=Coturnix japonica TaxID=93934 RepID=A0A8C2U3S0_COTJA
MVRATVYQLAIKHAIPLRWKQDARPVWVDQWPLPYKKLTALKELVSRELLLGHLEPSLSSWNTPVFVIRKSSGSFRLLHDLRMVNAQLILFGPVQQGSPLLSAVPEGWPLVVIDLKDCFFSIPLAVQDREAFAFTVPTVNNQGPAERYHWKVLPQGMACSPTICQLVVGKLIEPVRAMLPACRVAHYMDDLLLAAPSEVQLHDLERRVVEALTTAGFTISQEKIQKGPGIEFLGYRFGPTMVAPQGLDIKPHIRTLWDVQKLVGAIQWVRNALGIPPRIMKPFYDQLKGSDPREERAWTQEMDSAWQEILQACSSNALARWSPDQPLEGAVTKCQDGAVGILGHTLGSRPRPLWWLFSVQPARAFTSWLEQLSSLLQKIRLAAVRALGKEPDVIYIPSAFRNVNPLPDAILLALQGFGGKIFYSDSLPIYDLAKPLQISLKLRVFDKPMKGPTVFTDASSATGQGAVVWQNSSKKWEHKLITDKTVSVQVLEARAVAIALRLWPEIPCNVVTDSAFVAKLLLRMGNEGVPSTEIAFLLEEALAFRSAPVAILHVRSHSEVPGFFTTGNAMADRVAGGQVFTLQKARDLHSTLHIGARALSRTCSIPLSAARDVVQTCPHCNSAPVLGAGVNPRGLSPLDIWQTDFTFEQRMAPKQWLAVTIDTSSTIIIATQHARANSPAAQQHWATAIAALGLPQHIKTDNGSCFISRSTQDWLERWGISHSTGIPGNSQGQAIVERANRLLKDKIRVLGEGDGHKGRIPLAQQAEVLARALYAVNHFERGESKHTPIQRHWRPTIIDEGPPVKIKRDDGTWESGWSVLVWGRGYAAVKDRESGRILWVPSRKIKPDTAITQKDVLGETEN